jgi:glycosyltransferase involved in cell wall biosynthesis
VASETVGTYCINDALVRIRHLPQLAPLARAEGREVARAMELGSPPAARVTTIIPTFGRPALVAGAVASALGQTVRDHTVVVVVDGGGQPDLGPDPRLHVVVLGRHHGVPGLVRNVGIRISSSPYLAFLDDDNVWEPEHLELSLRAHAAGVTFTYTGLRQQRADGTEGETISVPYSRRTLRNSSYIDTSTMVVRRSRAVRFSRAPRGGSKVYEDWNLAFRLSRRRPPIHIPDVTVRYRLHPEGYMQRHL